MGELPPTCRWDPWAWGLAAGQQVSTALKAPIVKGRMEILRDGATVISSHGGAVIHLSGHSSFTFFYALSFFTLLYSCESPYLGWCLLTWHQGWEELAEPNNAIRMLPPYLCIFPQWFFSLQFQKEVNYKAIVFFFLDQSMHKKLSFTLFYYDVSVNSSQEVIFWKSKSMK